MLTPQLLRRIRQIELKSRRLVHNTFSGAYHSVYKGRGLSFASVRPYQPGDDIRSIDWKVTARTGETHIKQHIEERELTLMIVIDGSASVLFGTQDKRKRDFAAELGAVLAYAANNNNDKAGLLIFSDHIEHYIPPKKGRNHLLRIISDLLTIETTGKGTDLSLALRTTNRIVPSGAIIFLLSDFLMPARSYRKDLLLTGQRHELVNIILSDPLEDSLPDVGLMGMRDIETGDIRWVDTSSKKWQQEFREQRDTFVEQRQKAFHWAGVESVDMPPDGDYVRALTQFFQLQARKKIR
ncbi:MAG: DUF58 domain-containing protein [Phototrophicaceae bacterium]